jgi:hypothetical protein
VLIRREVLDGIVAGTVECVYRRWRKPAAWPGSTQLTAVGVLAVDAVDVVRPDELTEDDARRAGYRSLAALKSEVDSREGELYRIAVHYLGPDPRIALRENAGVDDELLARLSRLDRVRPWTSAVLRLIQRSPGVRAAELAEEVGRPTQKFKLDVRKLKALGLTESLEIGYRLSPRGAAVLRLTDR